jgi:uncharacterized membrane protein
MSICSSCGAQVGATAVCSSCGQSVALPAFLAPACYFAGWITGLIFLTWFRSAKPSTNPRVSFLCFHAAQSLVAFGGLTIIFFVVTSLSIPILSLAIIAAGFGLWLFLMFKAYQGQRYELPIAGDLAESIVKSLG